MADNILAAIEANPALQTPDASNPILHTPESTQLRLSTDLGPGDNVPPSIPAEPDMSPAGIKRRQERRSNAHRRELVSVVDIVQDANGIDSLQRPFFIEEITQSSVAMKEMDKEWRDYRGTRVANGLPFRWIHFSENNIEWVQVRCLD
jgi:hypothetical protein